MKPIPRIRGSMWPAFVILVLVLILPMMVIAQEDPGSGDSGEAVEEAPPDTGDTSVVQPEDVTTSSMNENNGVIIYAPPSQAEVQVLPEDMVEVVTWEDTHEFDYSFQKPPGFKVVDRPNDEGGGYSIVWPSSPTDSVEEEVEVTDEETGEVTTEVQQVSHYEYWVYESRTGDPGSWQMIGSIPSNTSYIWEDPARYGFFLSPHNHGSDEHVMEYEFTYPVQGIYSGRIESIDDQPGKVNVTVKLFDDSIEDYSTVPVFVDLTKIGGEKTQLEYVPSPPGAEIWDNTYTATTTWDQSKVAETKPKYLLITGEVSGNRRQIIESQGAMNSVDLKLANGLAPDPRTITEVRFYPDESPWKVVVAFENGEVEEFSRLVTDLEALDLPEDYQFTPIIDATIAGAGVDAAVTITFEDENMFTFGRAITAATLTRDGVNLSLTAQFEGGFSEVFDREIIGLATLGKDPDLELGDIQSTELKSTSANLTLVAGFANDIKLEFGRKLIGMTVQGEGGETELPDNRFNHFFRLYAVPSGYQLPEFADPPPGYILPDNLQMPEEYQLPPDEYMIGSTVGPIVANANFWNTGRTNTAIWALIICLAVMGYILAARRGVSLFLRRIAGLDHVEEAIGRATEMGRPILYTTGLGYVSDIATIASINILGQVAKKVANYETRLINPQRDPIVMAVCQEVVQNAYIDAGRPDAYNKDDIFFITDDQFAYTAAVNGIMVREKPATIILMGMFYAESLLLAETGASTGAIQIAGTDALAQLPFFITACDYTLIGEELYAASAYLSREPLLVGSLKGQDLAKLIFMIFTFLGTILIFMEFLPFREFINQLFQAF